MKDEVFRNKIKEIKEYMIVYEGIHRLFKNKKTNRFLGKLR